MKCSMLINPSLTTDVLIEGTLQSFSCAQMVRDFWAAGATVLTVLILCGSVVFPAFKMLVVL